MPKNKLKRNKQGLDIKKALLFGLGIGLVLILISPKCTKMGKKELINMSSALSDPNLLAVVDSLKRQGYAVENRYPIYIRFVKNHITVNPDTEAVNIAKVLYEYTGEDIRVELDFDVGHVFADRRGTIDPMDFMKEVEIEE